MTSPATRVELNRLANFSSLHPLWNIYRNISSVLRPDVRSDESTFTVMGSATRVKSSRLANISSPYPLLHMPKYFYLSRVWLHVRRVDFCNDESWNSSRVESTHDQQHFNPLPSKAYIESRATRLISCVLGNPQL